MSNQLYPKGKEQMLQAGINMAAGTVKACLVNTAVYTYNAANQFLSDLGASVIGTAVALGSKSFTNGVFNAANITFGAVAGGSGTVSALVLYLDTGTAGTSNLIAYFDTATGLPVVPNGGDISITWDTGANKIFAL